MVYVIINWIKKRASKGETIRRHPPDDASIDANKVKVPKLEKHLASKPTSI